MRTLSGILFIILSFYARAVPSAEYRNFGLHRFGEYVPWSESFEKFPKVLPRLEQGGTLSTVRIGLIDSLAPVDFVQFKPVSRPQIIDDLYYETLMLEDPVDGTDRMYPLIARAYRVPPDYGYVIFEINPAAKFQDGTPVTEQDVAFSFQFMLNVDSGLAELARRTITSVTTRPGEIQFNFSVHGQPARDSIMTLAKIKVLKPNTSPVNRVGGIEVPFVPTGPYRVLSLGPTRLSLIKDHRYWGAEINTRRGFFNYSQIDVLAFESRELAHASLGTTGNFYFEPQVVAAPRLAQDLARRGTSVQLIQETIAAGSQELASFALDPARPALQDVRVREALVLLYDFDLANRTLNGGLFRRPSGVLDESRIAVVGYPSPAVRQRMDRCTLPPYALQGFESYGNNRYAHLGDRRVRLLTANKNLFDAGYRMLDGKLVSVQPSGGTGPQLQLHALISTGEEARQMQIFRADLNQVGISLVVTAITDRETFQKEATSGSYDFIGRGEHLITRDLWPRADLARAIFAPLAIPCLDSLVADLERESPLGEPYRAAAEALARIQQGLYLNILTGQPRVKNFFLDPRVQVPAGLSVERAHMYGFWRP